MKALHLAIRIIVNSPAPASAIMMCRDVCPVDCMISEARKTDARGKTLPRDTMEQRMAACIGGCIKTAANCVNIYGEERHNFHPHMNPQEVKELLEKTKPARPPSGFKFPRR